MDTPDALPRSHPSLSLSGYVPTPRQGQPTVNDWHRGIKRPHLKTDHLHGIQYILQSSPTELAAVTPSLPKKKCTSQPLLPRTNHIYPKIPSTNYLHANHYSPQHSMCILILTQKQQKKIICMPTLNRPTNYVVLTLTIPTSHVITTLAPLTNYVHLSS